MTANKFVGLKGLGAFPATELAPGPLYSCDKRGVAGRRLSAASPTDFSCALTFAVTCRQVILALHFHQAADRAVEFEPAVAGRIKVGR